MQNEREKKLLPSSISATCDLRAHLKSISVFHMQYFFQSYCAWFFSACFKNEEKPDGIWFIFCQQYGGNNTKNMKKKEGENIIKNKKINYKKPKTIQIKAIRRKQLEII